MDGWFLTDNSTNFMKWRFPSTNLAANSYMVVFASNKNRQVPGAPLHTNFKLGSKAGNILALIKPDGVTVASSYNPYPVQVADISYGIPTHEVLTPLVSSGAVARVLVPTDRKSTRLNSSHTVISYAVFCLHKKTYPHHRPPAAPDARYHRHDELSLKPR